MEKISGNLKEAELKKRTLFKAYERLQSELTSFLSFTLPWKDLDEHLDGVRRSLERRSQELDEGERSLAERACAVAAWEEGLRLARQRVEECEEEVRRKKMELRSVEERLEKCRGEHREAESQLVAKRYALRECTSLIRDKKNQLSDLKHATDECRRDYHSKKEEVEVLRQELDSKEKIVRGVQSLLDENAQELEVKVQELGSVKRALDECSRTVKATSEELAAVQRLLDHSLKAHDDSEKRLSTLERTIEERDKELTVKARKLLTLENKMKDCQVELKAKAEELKGIHKSMEERSKELQCKESELLSMDISIEKHKEELKSKREEFEKINQLTNERLAAIALKDRELGSIQTSIGKLSKEFESKEREMENMVKRMKQCNEEAESKKEEIASVQAKLEVPRSLELKSRQDNAVQASIKAHNLELASKMRQLESVQIDITERAEQLRLKEKEYAFIQSSTIECSKALELKKKECCSMHHSIAECSQELESKKGQLDSIQKRSRECFAEVELKEKHLRMLDVSIGEQSRILEMRKKACNVQCAELELVRQQLHLIEKSLEKHSREMELRDRTRIHSGVVAQNWKHPLINGPFLASCQNCQPTIDFDGKNLQKFLYQHFQEHDRLCHKVLEIIQTSADAAKLVLIAMEGFYPLDSGNRDALLDIGVIRRSCIFLLENLILSSAQIKPQEREAAMKLAVEWKGKLNSSPSKEQDPLEVFGFLKLLVAYKLASAFDANGIQDLVNSVSQFQIAQELHQVLGSLAVAPGSLGSTQQRQIKTEEPENFAVHNADDSSVEYPPPPTYLARNDLQVFQIELSNENAMICKEISDTLQNSSDPAKLVLDVIAGSCTQNGKNVNLQTDVMRSQIVLLEQLVRISPSITHEVKEGAMKLAREWKEKLSDRPESALEVFAFRQFLAAYNLLSLFNDAPRLGQTLGLVNEITAPASIPAFLSRVHQQPPREKKRLASDRAIDVQSQSHARKSKTKMNDQGGPP